MIPRGCESPLPWIRRWRPAGAWAGAYLLVAGVLLLTGACRRQESGPGLAQTSSSCRECHQEQHRAWADSDHALANRVVDPTGDAVALALFQRTATDAGAVPPELVLGHKPLWQFLVAAERGRWQPHEWAFDPVKKEFFNVFGAENRQAGEWGHWTGRGMNWNSMCAQCHMTGYQKNYDAAADTYRSTWIEHGVGCVQCHGAMPAGHGKTKPAAPKPVPTPAEWQQKRTAAMHTCAPCHARNEALTANFKPGDDYFDHYRVTLPVERGVFWPDGQQRDEDFNWTSVLTSRMGHAGVTCLDCHDPHSNQLILPVAGNQLCLQCHGATGREMPVSKVRAPSIDPVAHSRHAEGSTGNSCVACHMPTTTYMQRAPRHDHGWLSPDPLLTKELGIPNACNGCHTDKSVDWAISAAEAWYGPKLDSRQRARARAVDAAQTGKPEAADRLLELIGTEEIPAWKATYLHLLGRTPAGADRIESAGRAALAAADPLVRNAAVELLTNHPDARRILAASLNDRSRLVRLAAAWALPGALPAGSGEQKEYEEYLALTADQPAGQLRIGQDLANRGQLPAAESHLRRAVEWDRNSAGLHDSLGLVLSAQGRAAQAAASFYRAGELNPADAEAMYRAGLAYAEAGMSREAATSLGEAVRRDPGFHRAWYNLGLLLAQAGKPDEAVAALDRAEAAAPAEPDYPYAAATIRWQQGDRAAARAAAERALRIDPGHEPARRFLRDAR